MRLKPEGVRHVRVDFRCETLEKEVIGIRAFRQRLYGLQELIGHIVILEWARQAQAMHESRHKRIGE